MKDMFYGPRIFLLGLVIASSGILVAGCGDDSESGESTDAGTGSETTAACGTLQEGAWTASGACLGMTMTMTLTLETDGCSFAFSDWNMTMSTPEGGTVAGQDVSFSGADWGSCTGLLSEDGSSVAGSCPELGPNQACEFEIHQVE